MHRQQLRQITLTEASFTSAEIMQKCHVSKCLKISEIMAWHLKFSNCSGIVLTFNELKKNPLSMTFSFSFNR